MAIRVLNITDETCQHHTILTDGKEVELTLWFSPLTQAWFMDVELEGRKVTGMQLVLGVFLLEEFNLPIGFVVSDLSGEGIDPFKRVDFVDGRCQLFMAEQSDMEEYRGFPVPV